MDQINIYLNAIFGDGRVVKTKSGKDMLNFYNTNKSLMLFKLSFFEKCTLRTTQPKYKNAKLVYYFNKTVQRENSEYMVRIKNIKYQDLILWLFDDGTLDIRRKTYTLSSKGLNLAENIELSWHLWHSFKISTKVYHHNHKQNQKLYWYIRFEPDSGRRIAKSLKIFAEENKIKDMEYKYEPLLLL